MFTIEIKADALAAAILALAEAMRGTAVVSGNKKATKEAAPKEVVPLQAEVKNYKHEEPAQATLVQAEVPQAEDVKTEPEFVPVTLQKVRETLAALSQAGKQVEVKALISKYGASKLTEIPQDKYALLLSEAGEIK